MQRNIILCNLILITHCLLIFFTKYMHQNHILLFLLPYWIPKTLCVFGPNFQANQHKCP